jgi:hypothetical protein
MKDVKMFVSKIKKREFLKYYYRLKNSVKRSKENRIGKCSGLTFKMKKYILSVESPPRKNTTGIVIRTSSRSFFIYL